MLWGIAPMRLGSASLLAPVSNCGDRHESCARYASEGRCRQLPEAYCPAACGLCADAAAAAAEDPCRPVPDAVGPGAVAAAFARAAALERLQPTLASTDPPVIIFDAFASAEEAERLATLAESVSFRSSGSSCGQKEVCSSASLSCVPVPGGDCWSEGAMRGLEARMLEALQLPAGNCEPLRFFRYAEGESFGLHHDASGQAVPRDSPGGPRVWTLYVFLRAPEGGGEFSMPALNLSITPKAGRAVMCVHRPCHTAHPRGSACSICP